MLYATTEVCLIRLNCQNLRPAQQVNQQISSDNTIALSVWRSGALRTNSLFPDCKGDQAGHVAREEVAATWLQVPVVVLAEQLEPRREQLPLGLG